MIAPRIIARAAACICLSLYRTDRSIRHSPGKCLGRYLKSHNLPRFPESRSEFMGEEKRVVATLGSQCFKRVTCAAPGQSEFADVPSSKLKAIRARLADQQLK